MTINKGYLRGEKIIYMRRTYNLLLYSDFYLQKYTTIITYYRPDVFAVKDRRYFRKLHKFKKLVILY